METETYPLGEDNRFQVPSGGTYEVDAKNHQVKLISQTNMFTPSAEIILQAFNDPAFQGALLSHLTKPDFLEQVSGMLAKGISPPDLNA